jgi:hypothetical protein
LYNHIATLQMQGFAFVQLQPNLSLVDNGVVDGVCLVPMDLPFTFRATTRR